MAKNKRRIQFNSKIESIFRWPLVYLILFVGMAFMAYVDASSNFVVYVVLFVFAIIVSVFMNILTRKNLTNEVMNFALNVGIKQNEEMHNFIIPYALMDPLGRIKWFNKAFVDLFDEPKLLGKNINVLFNTINPNQLEEDVFEKIQEYKGKTFKILFKKVLIEEDEKETLHRHRVEEETLYSLYMFDITRETALSIENVEQKGIVSLLFIDNYDDVLDSIEDVRRPLLIAMIDRNINKFAKSVEGVVKKFEKDKYVLFFQKKHLKSMKEEKFDILDSIRNINIGNEMSVTLSMAVGIDDKNYDLEYDYARVAMDLALGRGGDQAVIKENDKLSFYGGKTKSVEKSTRVKARIKAHAFRELIDECDRMIIMGHKVQDMDSLGAAVGIYACAKHFNKPAHIIIDNVTTSVKTLHTKLVESGDYQEDLFIKGIESAAYITNQTLLVIVDVNRPSYLEYPAILENVQNLVVFDHHRISAEYIEDATLSYVETYASSTCEMVTEIIRYISDRVKITPLEADALFAGISVDTKNFVTNAGVKTFEAAAFLKRYGADVVRVRKLFKNDMASYKAKATAVRDAQIYRDNMAISVCPSDVTNPNLVGAQAADELLNISGIKASFVLTESDNQVFISARSLDEINVQLIMEKLGGGGHLSVAGAQIDNKKMDEAIIMLKKTIDEFLEEGE